MDRYTAIRRVLFVTLGLNLAVSALKLAAGYEFGSISMVADGFHSFFDASSNVIGLIGIWIASKPPDEAHPYGHRKYETFAALVVALMLFLTCFEVLEGAFRRFSGGNGGIEAHPAGFAVMLVSIFVNAAVSRYETVRGRQLGSEFLLADAGHTRSDILASASVLASLGLARLGYPRADAVAAVVIAVMIGRVGYRIMKGSSRVLLDEAALRADEVVGLCMSVPGVRRCHRVRSRGPRDEVSLDLCVHVDPELPTSDAHEIAHQVTDRIKDNMPGVLDVVVHVEPEER